MNTDMNRIVGTGHYSHAVPTEIGQVVTIRDGHHAGTEIYQVEGGFRFVSLDLHTVSTVRRCALVRLAVSIDEVEAPYGCDLGTPDGLVLVGLDLDEDPSELGEVIWDSKDEEEVQS